MKSHPINPIGQKGIRNGLGLISGSNVTGLPSPRTLGGGGFSMTGYFIGESLMMAPSAHGDRLITL